jgi:uncharacterized membrane protein
MSVSPRRRHAREDQARVADAITRFSGSFLFIQIHIVWFAAWIVLNLIPATRFDKFPFGLLTLIVSLEAIFLSTFVLISQNRSSQRDLEREEDELRVSVLTGVWVEQIGEKLGVSHDEVERVTQTRLAADDDDAAAAAAAAASKAA